MILTGGRSQPNLDETFDFSGTITAGGTAQTLLPQQPWRTWLFFTNISTGNLTLAIGAPPATAGLTNGVVTSITIPDGGLGFTIAPQVVLLGGLVRGDLRSGGPANPAQVVVSLTGSAINTTAVIANGGSGYLVAPYVQFLNPLPFLGGGTGTPSATSGIVVLPNGSFVMESSAITTSAVSVWGATTTQAFTCKVMGW